MIFLDIECMAYYPVEWALKGFTPLSVSAVSPSLFITHPPEWDIEPVEIELTVDCVSGAA